MYLGDVTPVAHQRTAVLTLVLAITTLHLLVLSLLHLSLEDARPLRLVESGDLEDLGRVQPRVGSPPHHSDAFTHPVVHQLRGARRARQDTYIS